jgi:hypothetical protein
MLVELFWNARSPDLRPLVCRWNFEKQGLEQKNAQVLPLARRPDAHQLRFEPDGTMLPAVPPHVLSYRLPSCARWGWGILFAFHLHVLEIRARPLAGVATE